MAVHTLTREQFIPRPIEEVFGFFSNAANLQAITPPHLDFRILTPQPVRMEAGTLLDYRLKWHGIPIRWRTRILEWNPPLVFVDLQLQGPYRLWHHTHTFRSENGSTVMQDIVKYELPLGPLGELAHTVKVRSDVGRIFDFRRDTIARLFTPTGVHR